MAYTQKRDYLRAMADHGHLLWLRFGVLGIAIRLCILTIAIAIALALGFSFKRLRANS